MVRNRGKKYNKDGKEGCWGRKRKRNCSRYEDKETRNAKGMRKEKRKEHRRGERKKKCDRRK